MVRTRVGVVLVVASAFVAALLVVPSAGAVSAAPAGASAFHGVTPKRVMDTRSGVGVPAGVRKPGSTTALKVTGVAGVPANATAVVMNVTIDQSTKKGYVQVFPTGDGTPGASSNLNVPGPGSTRPNLVIVPVGAGGRVTFYTAAGGHLVADMFGYFAPSGATKAGRYVGLPAPVRTLDTRDTRKVPVANPGDVVNCGDFSTWAQANTWFWRYRRHGDPAKLDGDGDGIPCASLPGNPGYPFQPPNIYKRGAGSTYRLPILQSASPDGGVVPAGATAVVVNFTAVQASNRGYLQAYASPNGAANGAHSNLNFIPGETAPNLAIVPIGADGAIKIYAHSGVHVVADIIGYFTGGNAPTSEAGLFVPFAPERLVDAQMAPKTLQNRNVASLSGLNAAGVAAMFLNVTLASSIGSGYLQVFPTGKGTPGASSTVNVSSSGATRANAAITGLSNGSVSIYHFAGGRYVLDAAGYFASP